MLKINNGVSYNKRNLGYYRRFYILFPNVQIMNARVHNLSCLPIRCILSGFFVNLGGKNNAYLWLKYLIISTLISIIKVADVRIF